MYKITFNLNGIRKVTNRDYSSKEMAEFAIKRAFELREKRADIYKDFSNPRIIKVGVGN